MKHFSWHFGLILVFFLISTAMSQEDIIIINSATLPEHEKPLVKFYHKNHADLIECARCHHNYDEFGTNTGGEEQECLNCHTPSAKSNPVPLVRAFHLQCKGCHKVMAKKGREKVPLMCGQCHVRK